MLNDQYTIFMPGTNGQAVLLVHGLTGAPAEMSFVGKKLNRQGYTVYCPLLTGHGKTKEDLLATNWQDWSASVKQGYDFLAKDHSKVYAAGICVGGTLALNVAAQHPDTFAGIALYSMTFRYDGWNMSLLNKMSFLLPLANKFKRFRKIEVHEEEPFGVMNERIRKKVIMSGALAGCLPTFPYPALLEMRRLSEEVRRSLPKIKTPVLAIHAKDDDVSHIRNSKYLVKHLGGERELHVLEKSYHMIHVDQERDTVADLTQEFFKKHA